MPISLIFGSRAAKCSKLKEMLFILPSCDGNKHIFKPHFYKKYP